MNDGIITLTDIHRKMVAMLSETIALLNEYTRRKQRMESLLRHAKAEDEREELRFALELDKDKTQRKLKDISTRALIAADFITPEVEHAVYNVGAYAYLVKDFPEQLAVQIATGNLTPTPFEEHLDRMVEHFNVIQQHLRS